MDGNLAKWLWCQDEIFKHDTQKAQTIKEKAENADSLKIKIVSGTGLSWVTSVCVAKILMYGIGEEPPQISRTKVK